MRGLSRLELSFLLLAVVSFVAVWTPGIHLFTHAWKMHADDGFLMRLVHTVIDGFKRFYYGGDHPINAAAMIIGQCNSHIVLFHMQWLLAEAWTWDSWGPSVWTIIAYHVTGIGPAFPFYLYLFPRRYFSRRDARKRRGVRWLAGFYALYSVATTIDFPVRIFIPQMKLLHSFGSGPWWSQFALLITTFDSTWWFMLWDTLGVLVAMSLFSVYAMNKTGLNGAFFGIGIFCANWLSGGGAFAAHCAYIEWRAVKERRD